ncbi:hypothetical protein [Facklamia sp. P9177]|uniref:hypothetical protein n=1 Tax=Facklamia sp. P9177 TaxID=3421945 RepID=UPI003D1673E0
MNKVALIAPANVNQMPYLKNYEKILNKYEIDYDVINWDRTHTEKKSKNVYLDSKNSYRRNFLDYLKYSRFIKKRLKSHNYKFLIIFSPHLVFFLQFFLLINSYNYIIDIRDYHPIIKFLLPKTIKSSKFIAVSSPGYKKYFNHKKIFINHNFNKTIKEFNENINSKTVNKNTFPLTVSLIGSLRDIEINKEFIKHSNNNENLKIVFNGEGGQEQLLKEFVEENKYKNVFFTGRYEKIQEDYLYKQSDLINVMRYNDSINNNYALTNRLYNSVFNLKPLISMGNTYQSKIIKKYGLGLIITDFNDISQKIENYLFNLDKNNFIRNCEIFINIIIQENNVFEQAIVTEIKNLVDINME